MDIDLTIKNYRCFPEGSPARLTLRTGVDYVAFLGVNNSGKSTLLKFFYELRSLFTTVASVGQLVQSLNPNAGLFQRAPATIDIDEIFSLGSDGDMEIVVSFSCPGTDSLGRQSVPVKIAITIPRNGSRFRSRLVLEDESSPISFGDVGIDEGGMNFKGRLTKLAVKGLLEPFRLLGNTLYIGAFRNAVNVGAAPNYYDIKTGEAFIRQWHDIRAGGLKRDDKLVLKLRSDVRELFGFDDFDMIAMKDFADLKLTIAEKDQRKYQRLSEVGSGLAQVVIVFANAILARPSYILIDEPELNLHPGLQWRFLRKLRSYASEGVLFATHSFGLAHSCNGDIYTVLREREGVSKVREYEECRSLSDILEELSYSGYHGLGFRKLLLVEGHTDIRTFRRFLRWHDGGEDIAIDDLGGSSGISGNRDAELLEKTRLSKEVCAIIDSERTRENDALSPKRQAFVESCRKLGIRCDVLKYRAIENYFTREAIEKVTRGTYAALEPYESWDDKPRWNKNDNWRIAKEMTRKDLDGTDLGALLARVCADA